MNEELLLSTLQDVARRMKSLEGGQGEIRKVIVDLDRRVQAFQAAVLDDSNRVGGQVKKHAGEIIQLDARVTKVERATRARVAGNGSAR